MENWLSTLDHVATVLLVAGTVIGLACANLDADAIEAEGWPRLATAIRWGRRLGGLAVQLRALKSGEAPEKKDGAA